MRAFALAFLLGTLALQHSPQLPDPGAALAGVAALLALLLARSRAARVALLLAAGGLAGFGLAAWRAQERLDDALPFAWEGRDVHVSGVIADLPQVKERATRFVLDVEAVATPGA